MKVLCRNPKCSELVGLNGVYCSILCEQDDSATKWEELLHPDPLPVREARSW